MRASDPRLFTSVGIVYHSSHSRHTSQFTLRRRVKATGEATRYEVLWNRGEFLAKIHRICQCGKIIDREKYMYRVALYAVCTPARLIPVCVTSVIKPWERQTTPQTATVACRCECDASTINSADGVVDMRSLMWMTSLTIPLYHTAEG